MVAWPRPLGSAPKRTVVRGRMSLVRPEPSTPTWGSPGPTDAGRVAPSGLVGRPARAAVEHLVLDRRRDLAVLHDDRGPERQDLDERLAGGERDLVAGGVVEQGRR